MLFRSIITRLRLNFSLNICYTVIQHLYTNNSPGGITVKKKKVLRFILIYLLSGIAFFVLTLPFHKLLSVFTVTEVRPSAVLYPFLGISFGLPSALGIMTANFISDAMNGYSLAILFEGLIPQLLYTMVPYYIWKWLMKGEDHKHRLDCAARVLKYALVCLAFSLLSALGVGLLMYINFHIDPTQAALFVLLNNFHMSLVLGCPLMVISNQIISRRAGTDRTLTRNEIIIIITAAVQVVLFAGVAITVYAGGKTMGTYDIWNTIYIIEVVMISVTLPISLGCMALFGKSKNTNNNCEKQLTE